ncbi:hypothetical protein DUI87_09971 [Hirundo rustica rustica]|uniref:Uncharacterized protein n=1 Tax=Hirundo rustica rustica TaxID=333673 RepID=A0A3M0KH99_HIRRU|nr:hypothetical protein DUI87_09971 [Hirundo rustica rustica]
MPEILKTDRFTLDGTLGDQQASVPGQGMLVDEDLRGWDRRAEAMECCRGRNPFSSLSSCHPEGAGNIKVHFYSLSFLDNERRGEERRGEERRGEERRGEERRGEERRGEERRGEERRGEERRGEERRGEERRGEERRGEERRGEERRGEERNPFIEMSSTAFNKRRFVRF